MQRLLHFLIFCLSWQGLEALPEDPVETILQRAEQYLRKGMTAEDVKNLMVTLNEQDQWPDIDYTDQQPSAWSTATHLNRVRSMTLAWTDATSVWFHDAALKAVIDRALDHWLSKRYHNPNWWHNEIGIPRIMQDILVMLRHDLRGERFKQAMDVLGQHKVRGTGANLAWSADLGLHYGALLHDPAMIQRCSQLISNEIKVSEEEGIQPDYSFHQHGARLQTCHYGNAFLSENVKVAWELRDTPWAFAENKIDILSNFVLDGWQWMSRGIYTVPGTLDRSVSRRGMLESADLRNLLPYLITLDEKKADVLDSLAKRQDGEDVPLKGYRYFPWSDFAAYQRPDFSFFVKTISVRTRFTESINGENLKGSLLNSGDTYFMRDGQEYFNLMPVWDWAHLPGITTFDGAKTVQQKFTGGVSNGESGVAAMHYRAEDDRKNLTVNKLWASHGDVVVCMLSDLTTENTGVVYTVLDQCRWRGEVRVNKPAKSVGEGTHHLKNVNWIFHSGFAYIPLAPSPLELHLKEAHGTWASINKGKSQEVISEKVFMPVYVHRDEDPSSFGYAVVSCKSAKEAREIARHPDWKIIRNDRECQAVVFTDGTFMAAFSSEGSVRVDGKRELALSRPGLVLISDGHVFVSDPTHTGGSITVQLGDQQWVSNLTDDGTTQRVN